MGEGPIPRMMQGRKTRGHEPPNVVERGGGMEIGAARCMRQSWAGKGIVVHLSNRSGSGVLSFGSKLGKVGGPREDERWRRTR